MGGGQHSLAGPLPPVHCFSCAPASCLVAFHCLRVFEPVRGHGAATMSSSSSSEGAAAAVFVAVVRRRG
jgi:hypothetical protein